MKPFIDFKIFLKYIDWRWLSKGEIFALFFYSTHSATFFHKRENFHHRSEKKVPFFVASTRFIYFICLSYLSSVIRRTREKQRRKLIYCLTILNFLSSFNSRFYHRDQFGEIWLMLHLLCRGKILWRHTLFRESFRSSHRQVSGHDLFIFNLNYLLFLIGFMK